MRRSDRLILAALGLAAAVYGLASLTGGWLGTPPWWEHPVSEPPKGWVPNESIFALFDGRYPATPREGREWISGAVVAAGLALAALALWPALWPRKPREGGAAPPSQPSR